MTKSLPHILFNSKTSTIKGVEILRLEDIGKRKDGLTHSPESAHQIQFYELILVTEGKSQHLVDFNWYNIEPNSVLSVTKGQVNAFKFKDGLKGYVILFTEDYFKKQLNRLPKDAVLNSFTSHLISPKVELTTSSNLPKYFVLLFDEFYKTATNSNQFNIIDSLFNIIFSEIEHIKRREAETVNDSTKLHVFLKFQNILKSDFAKNRNALYYAEKLNISYKHLNVVCRELIHLSAKQYIDEFVILESKRALINSEIKSTELAYQMGFEESTNFIKYFKKHTGFTPNNFKNNHK